MTLLEEAIEHFEFGQVHAGLELLKSLQQETDDDALVFNIAEVYANYGFLQEAVAISKRLLQSYPNHSEILLFSAEYLIELGEDGEAIELLNSLDKKGDDYLRGLLLLADLYLTKGLEEVAENKLLEAYELNGKEPVIWYALGQFYLLQGDYFRAHIFLEKVLGSKDFAQDSKVQLQFAETLSMLGQFEKALPYFEEGIQSEVNLDSLFQYGHTAYKAEKYETAIDALTKLLTLDPHYTTLYPLLANAYAKTGNIQAALTTLRQGVQKDEQYEELYFLLGKYLLKVGEKEEAEVYFKKCLELPHPPIEAIHLYISYLKKNYRQEEMIEHILHFKQTHHVHDPVLDWELAEAYHANEKFDEAKIYFEEAQPYLNENSEFLEQYGYFLLEEGKRSKALLYFKKALAIDKERVHLEELIVDLENRDE